MKYITVEDIMKRGWTKGMIDAYIPRGTAIISPNKHNIFRITTLYPFSIVEELEQTKTIQDEFKNLKKK